MSSNRDKLEIEDNNMFGRGNSNDNTNDSDNAMSLGMDNNTDNDNEQKEDEVFQLIEFDPDSFKNYSMAQLGQWVTDNLPASRWAVQEQQKLKILMEL